MHCELDNDLSVGDKIWLIYSVKSADDNRFCPTSMYCLLVEEQLDQMSEIV